jgi:DNA uptake protein ComE-like DNA-binding protein
MSAIKRIKHFVKTYFYFSKTERQSVLGLVVLILAVAITPWLYARFIHNDHPNISIEVFNVADSLYQSEEETIDAPTGFHYFDPNNATDADWKQFGISDKQIESIRKFLKSGAVIRRPADISKLYALTEKQKALIIPYIDLPDMVTIPHDSTRYKKKLNYPIELNTADSNTIVALYRIGPSLTHRIIDYRDKLGGFKSLSQLNEIWGFDEDILYDLQGKIYVDSTKARIFNLNTVTADELKTHPYFKYKLSNVIINYRTQHGPYKSLAELKETGVVNDSVYQRITRYLKIE